MNTDQDLINEITKLAIDDDAVYNQVGKRVGYARTSTSDQVAGLQSQQLMLKNSSCDVVFSEHISAVNDARPEFMRAIDALSSGDTLVVTTMSRLVRRVRDLSDIKEQIESKGANLEILDLKLDTSTAIGKMTLQIIAAVSEMERELMLERQKIGIEKAKRDGKYKGKKATTSLKLDEVLRLNALGLKKEDIAKLTGMGVASVYRLLRQQIT